MSKVKGKREVKYGQREDKLILKVKEVVQSLPAVGKLAARQSKAEEISMSRSSFDNSQQPVDHINNPSNERQTKTVRPVPILGPYMKRIDELIALEVRGFRKLTAVFIFNVLRAEGYIGSLSSIQRYLRQQRKAPEEAKASIRRIRRPGPSINQNQYDFPSLEIATKQRKLNNNTTQMEKKFYHKLDWESGVIEYGHTGKNQDVVL